MTPGSFNQDDRVRVHAFIQMVTEHMRLNPDWDTKKALEYIRLLGYMQNELMAKIEANILEAQEVIEPPKPSSRRK